MLKCHKCKDVSKDVCFHEGVLKVQAIEYFAGFEYNDMLLFGSSFSLRILNSQLC